MKTERNDLPQNIATLRRLAPVTSPFPLHIMFMIYNHANTVLLFPLIGNFALTVA